VSQGDGIVKLNNKYYFILENFLF